MLSLAAHRIPGWSVLALLVVAGVARGDDRGGAIYKAKCASCHGERGEGVEDEYPKPLVGERSATQLTRLIAKTMPQGAEGTCVGEDAEAVASYIYDAFYSPIAQARNRPARIDLSRLTVRQYRNAVTDVIGNFRGPSKPGDGIGLKATYYKGAGFNPKEKQIERVDARLSFDFGPDSPDPEKLDANQFSIRWEGALIAPETGTYEIVLRTDHAGRVWLNDNRKPLIDAWVKSGDDTEFRESITLLGGRPYPIKVEFSKAKQGVQDKKFERKDIPPASIALAWRTPNGPVEIIPDRYLRTGNVPELFVVTSPFPPDDRSIGYERGTTVSKEWDLATTDAAMETTAYVASRLDGFAGTKEQADDRVAKWKNFLGRFAERAFRRPLDDETREIYIDRQFATVDDPNLAAKRSLLLILKSPRFLYREAGDSADPFDVASRIAFGLWDSIPDQPLLDAARQGKLKTRKQVAAQAERMLDDPRARTKLRHFLFQWLKVDQAHEIGKDPKLFPDFDEEVVADLRSSLDLFLDGIAWGDRPDYRRFLLDELTPINGKLAALYGVDAPSGDASFRDARLPGSRAGVLTHPYVLTTFAYTAATSPIHRGVFIVRGLLGITLQPPPEAVAPLAPDLHPNLTTRERTNLQTSPAACQSCHSLINPLGYTLENYDAIGRWQTEEQGRTIDATGSYQPRSGDMLAFQNARDLAIFLANSDEAHDAFVEKLFHEIVKQPVRAYGPGTRDEIRQTFASQDFHVRKLMVEIVARTALGKP